MFAFAGAATFFGAEGLRFARAPLAGPSLDEWVGALPRGTVIVAAAAYTPVPLELSGIDRRDPRGLGQPRSFSAFVRMVGESDVARAAGHAAISLAVEPGMLDARLPVFPGTVRSSADERGARVELAGRTIAHAATGLAIAVFSPDGALARAFTLQRDQPLRVPFEEALYELEGENACVDVGTDRWSDVTPALHTGSWVATLPAIGSVVIDTAIADSRGLRSRTSLLLGSGAALQIDRAPGADGTEVLSTELTRTRGGRPVFRQAFDRPVVAARARLKPGGARSSVRVCAQEMFPLFADGASQAVLRPDFESEAYFGPGWGDVEQTATGRVRRGEDRATLLLPLQRGYDYRVFLDLAGATGTRIDIAFNNDAIGACALGSGVPCEVALPRGAVRDGTNTLTLTTQGSSPMTFQSAQILRQAVEGFPVVDGRPESHESAIISPKTPLFLFEEQVLERHSSDLPLRVDRFAHHEPAHPRRVERDHRREIDVHVFAVDVNAASGVLELHGRVGAAESRRHDTCDLELAGVLVNLEGQPVVSPEQAVAPPDVLDHAGLQPHEHRCRVAVRLRVHPVEVVRRLLRCHGFSCPIE